MTADGQTKRYYDAEAASYSARAAEHMAEAEPWLEAVAAAMPEGGDVLDFGCGSAWAAAWFRDRGFAIDAFDASEGLAAIARADHGIEVRLASFESLAAEAAFDAVWASFCLLHAPRAEMPGHLGRIAAALRPGGTFYLGLKEGTGEARDALGRHYTYYTEPEITGLLTGAGFGVDRVGRESGTGADDAPYAALHMLASRNA